MKLDETLTQKLKQWEISIELPSRFQAEVWQRIAAREASRRHSPWRQFVRLFFVELATPRYAVAAIFISALAGVGAAQVQAGNTNFRHWKNLEARYLESIDPLEHISAN